MVRCWGVRVRGVLNPPILAPTDGSTHALEHSPATTPARINIYTQVRSRSQQCHIIHLAPCTLHPETYPLHPSPFTLFQGESCSNLFRCSLLARQRFTEVPGTKLLGGIQQLSSIKVAETWSHGKSHFPKTQVELSPKVATVSGIPGSQSRSDLIRGHI